jgi:quinolinate synthase
MKVTTLEKVRDSLERMQHVITVSPEIAARARTAIERMVSIGSSVPAQGTSTHDPGE